MKCVGLLAALAVLAAGAGVARADGFTTFDNPGGGRVIAGALPAGDATTRAALVDMLRRTHTYFGAKPAVNRLVVTPDGSSALAFFSETSAQGPVWGVVVASAGPGVAPYGALVFDAAGHLPQTLPALMKKAQSLRPPPPPDPATAGALPLTRQAFADGSGSVGVPAGWTMASFREGRFLEASKGQPIIFGQGLRFAPIVPGSFMARATQRFPPPPGISEIYLPFDPDPVRTMLALFGAMARASGAPPGDFALVKLMAEKRTGQMLNATEWTLEFLYRGPKGRIMHYFGVVSIAPPAQVGSWFVFEALHIVAPADQFPGLQPTFFAILRSLRLNQQVIQSELKASNDQFQANLKANQRAFQANFQRNEANIQRQSDASHAAARAFIRTIQGTTVIANPATGTHYLAPADIAGALVRADPRHFQMVPLSGYIKGLDY